LALRASTHHRPRPRDPRLVAAALAELEAATAQAIRAEVPAGILKRWPSAVETTRPDGQPCQGWLWSAPAKHSTRQIGEVLERIAFLTELGIDRHLGELNDVLVRRYARRMATRPPSVSARIKEPARTVEVACFLRYCLLTASDQDWRSPRPPDDSYRPGQGHSSKG
jgi:hypothetical protein